MVTPSEQRLINSDRHYDCNNYHYIEFHTFIILYSTITLFIGYWHLAMSHQNTIFRIQMSITRRRRCLQLDPENCHAILSSNLRTNRTWTEVYQHARWNITMSRHELSEKQKIQFWNMNGLQTLVWSSTGENALCKRWTVHSKSRIEASSVDAVVAGKHQIEPIRILHRPYIDRKKWHARSTWRDAVGFIITTGHKHAFHPP